jgi:hypothetical protein
MRCCGGRSFKSYSKACGSLQHFFHGHYNAHSSDLVINFIIEIQLDIYYGVLIDYSMQKDFDWLFI